MERKFEPRIVETKISPQKYSPKKQSPIRQRLPMLDCDFGQDLNKIKENLRQKRPMSPVGTKAEATPLIEEDDYIPYEENVTEMHIPHT